MYEFFGCDYCTLLAINMLCIQCKTTDDGKRNCPIHVQSYSKNKFEELVHPVGVTT